MRVEINIRFVYSFLLTGIFLLFPLLTGTLSPDEINRDEAEKMEDAPEKEKSVLPDYHVQLKDGKVTRSIPQKVDELPLTGYVISIYFNKNELFYLMRENESQSMYAGCYSFGVETKTEVKVEYNILEGNIKKLYGSKGLIYLLQGNGNHSEKSLIIIDLSSGDIRTIDGVLDFFLSDEILFTLKTEDDNGEKKFILTGNEKKVTLGIKGELRIKGILDSRIFLVTNGTETEIVDFVLLRSLYQYSPNKIYMTPDEYNLVIEEQDMIPGEMENRVYYRILINGKDKGRTGVGMSPEVKTLSLMLEPGKYYLVFAERWTLDKKQNKYIRANNIYQPKPVKIFIPDNRVLKLNIMFNGKEYRISENLVIAK